MKIFVGVLITLAVVIAIFALVRFGLTGQEGEEFVYDVSKLAKIDPNLILYEESGQPISTGFTNSRGIAVDPPDVRRVDSKGLIYVAGDKAIRVFGEDGNLLSEIKLADMPRCLTVADDGKIYIGMKNYIEIYSNEGKKLAGWRTFGDETVLTSIAVSKDDVFIADAGKRIVLRCDTAGSLIKNIGQKNENKNIPGFVIPSPYFDLAVASDGLLCVVNPGRHRIEAYSVDGDLEFSWGEFSSDLKGFCGCCNPVNFAILEDGSFVTCEKGIIRVKIYDPAGNFVGVVAGPEQLLAEGAAHVCETAAECQTGGFDVAAGLRGQIFVLDTIKNVVRTFTRKKAG
jgi:hypothetical protein